jgi:hypothetical protein
MSRAAALIFQSSRVVGITLVRSVGSTEVGEIWRTLKNDLFNPYRPTNFIICAVGVRNGAKSTRTIVRCDPSSRCDMSLGTAARRFGLLVC